MRSITKIEMARILNRYTTSGLYNVNPHKICEKYSWKELHDLYEELDESISCLYS